MKRQNTECYFLQQSSLLIALSQILMHVLKHAMNICKRENFSDNGEIFRFKNKLQLTFLENALHFPWLKKP